MDIIIQEKFLLKPIKRMKLYELEELDDFFIKEFSKLKKGQQETFGIKYHPIKEKKN